MGNKEIEIPAESLKMLKDKINLGKMKEPSFLMALTGTDLAYRRNDGALLIAVGHLKD